MKNYEVKLYSQSGEFKKQINPKNITSSITFSEQLDGGQSNITLDIVGDNTDFLCSDIIEIRETVPNAKQNFWNDLLSWDDSEIWEDGSTKVMSTYTGIIERVSVQEFKQSELVKLEVLGVFTILNDFLYESEGNRTFVKTDTISNIIKDIIDVLNVKYGVLAGNTQNLGIKIIDYTASSIQITTDSVSIEFSNNDCLSAIKKVIANTNYNFFINSEGICFLKSIENQVNKNLTFEREIVSIEITRKKDDMVNKYLLERNGGIVKTYENPTSIATFNTKEKFESKTDIQNEATQDLQGNTKVSDFGVERNEISLTIKAQKNNFLQPGDLITTLNTKNQIVEKQITKIQKNRDFWILSIGDFTSFGKSVLKK